MPSRTSPDDLLARILKATIIVRTNSTAPQIALNNHVRHLFMPYRMLNEPLHKWPYFRDRASEYEAGKGDAPSREPGLRGNSRVSLV